jgi:Protein of unknown function (DUF2568)
MELIKSTNVGLRFLLEMCALAALGYWGFHTGDQLLLKLVLGLGAPLMAAILWATLGAPGAGVKLSGELHLALEVMIFGAAIVALAKADRPSLAGVFAVVFIINRVLMAIWRQ